MHLSRKIKQRPYSVLAFCVALIGLVLVLFVNMLLGALLIVVAACIDRARYLCEECGNRVEKTSRMCPVCRVPLR